jgi:hypothetical protein
MGNNNIDIVLIDEKEVKKHVNIIKKELPMMDTILDDIESIITLTYKLITLLEKESQDAMSKYNDEQLCLRLNLARSLACNAAASTAAIVSLFSEYVKDKTIFK